MAARLGVASIVVWCISIFCAIWMVFGFCELAGIFCEKAGGFPLNLRSRSTGWSLSMAYEALMNSLSILAIFLASFESSNGLIESA